MNKPEGQQKQPHLQPERPPKLVRGAHGERTVVFQLTVNRRANEPQGVRAGREVKIGGTAKPGRAAPTAKLEARFERQHTVRPVLWQSREGKPAIGIGAGVGEWAGCFVGFGPHRAVLLQLNQDISHGPGIVGRIVEHLSR